jgi:hypothetical protein
MTDSTATKTAANGGKTIGNQVPAQREHGIQRLREQECYQMTSLIGDCLTEAEHVVRKLHNKVYNRVLDNDGSRGTHPLDREEARQILNEAYDCTALALEYLFSASLHLRDQADEPEPPF